ncbi:MAG TPA: hypothetical protein VKU41_12845 [Polyangiaceae bacterium]|nr:hypothetical protein [Polyangiaceae bacterium]
MAFTPPPLAGPARALVPPVRRLARWALVLGGYVGAALLAGVALAVRQASVDPLAASAAGGMYAAGDTMLYLGVFGMASLAPTGLALYLLRDTGRLWAALAGTSVAIAATAPLAVLAYALDRSWIGGLSVLRLLASPLLAAGFSLGFLICPRPPTPGRRTFLFAAAIEGSVTLVVILRFSVALVLGR